jgi:4-amino-4-deoxy-L-arabinose transferase-like glycosyltransferase
MLGDEGLWLDEALTGWRTQSWPSIFKHEASVPPFYYICVKISRTIFGDGPWGLRFISVVAGAALGPALYWVCSPIVKSKAAFVAGLMGVISAYSLRYSIEARCYSLGAFLAIMCSGFLWRMFFGEGVSKKRWWIGLGLFGSALVLTHNWGIVFVAGFFSVGIGIIIYDRNVRARCGVHFLWSSIMIGVAFAAYFPFLIRGICVEGAKGELWPCYPVSTMIRGILSTALYGESSVVSVVSVGAAIVGLVFCLRGNSKLSFWGWGSLMVLLYAALVQFIFPHWIPQRYDFIFWGIFPVAVTVSVYHFVQSRMMKAVAYAILSVFFIMEAGTFFLLPEKSSSRMLAEAIDDRSPDVTIVASHRRFDPLLIVPLSNEFAVLRGKKPLLISSPTFEESSFAYVEIPPLYRDGVARQSISVANIKAGMSKVLSTASRCCIVGPMVELHQLNECMGPEWILVDQLKVPSQREGVVCLLTFDNI